MPVSFIDANNRHFNRGLMPYQLLFIFITNSCYVWDNTITIDNTFGFVLSASCLEKKWRNTILQESRLSNLILLYMYNIIYLWLKLMLHQNMHKLLNIYDNTSHLPINVYYSFFFLKTTVSYGLRDYITKDFLLFSKPSHYNTTREYN